MRRFPIGPFVGLVTLVVVTLVAAQVLSVPARGRVVSDFTDDPIADAEVSLGSRVTRTDAEGSWSLGLAPVGAQLRATADLHETGEFPASQEVVRLVPRDLEVTVTDATAGTPISGAEVRLGTELSRTSDAGIAVIDHPARDEAILVCAADYHPAETVINATKGEVKLEPNGPGCPPLPTPSPTPPPTPSPSPSPSPAPSPTPSPTGSG